LPRRPPPSLKTQRIQSGRRFAQAPLPELPASALYSHPSLGRLWKKVHLAHSPFLKRSSIRSLYTHPAKTLRLLLKRKSYHWIALGCADGLKEALLLKKLHTPVCLLTADTNLNLARQAGLRLPALKKICRKIDLTLELPVSFCTDLQRVRSNPNPKIQNLPRLITLFGVLPNLPPLPLLQRISRFLRPMDFLLFSANLAPGSRGRTGTLRILPQYDNLPTRRWLSGAISRLRPKWEDGSIAFGVFPDPLQPSLSRIEARWMVNKNPTHILFASRRPTARQVEAWLKASGLSRVRRWMDSQGEEAVWLVTRKA